MKMKWFLNILFTFLMSSVNALINIGPEKREISCRDMFQSAQLNSSMEVDLHNSETLDRISALPRNLVHHILRFFSTKDAVATSVLSKKWRYAWVNVPALDFTDLPSTNLDGTINQEKLACFKNFMNRVLLIHAVPCLEYVRFETCDGLHHSNIFEWLLVIARRSAKELYLSNKVPLLIGLPSKHLLAKEELAVLKLEGVYFQEFPCSVYLPRLRILSLKEAGFVDVQDPFATILSNCPILEELNIDCCTGLEKFSVQSSSLRSLRIVSHDKGKKPVIIKTPNLESLYLSIGINQSLVDDLPSLVEARLEVWTSTVRCVTLLQKFRFIKTLVLCGVILDGSNVVNKLLAFDNLAVLEVAFSPWPIVLQVLRNAPNVTYLSIQKLMFGWPDTLPKGNFSLERIEYHCFDVIGEGYDIVQFFLSCNVALKKLKIHMQSWVDCKLENEIMKSLLNMPRASNQCQITIVNGDENAASDMIE